MDLPHVYEFFVDDEFVNFFNEKLNLYKTKSNLLIPKNSSATYNGIQTHNMLTFGEKDVEYQLNIFKNKIEKKCGTNFYYHWSHLIEYENSGHQKIHKHDHNEDFSIILYLNTCEDGETIFHINQVRNITYTCLPKRGKCIMFSSTIYHGANKSFSNKRVLVLGLKLKELTNNYGD
jgi:hypothetical protein